ncbi:hypothetical protein GUITHDRAFT_155618, partial [Guillardia theta CCMP2712]|mmetsp:Transcript_35162/g.109909  ORF Transcript_35162/g.109909 Transcript_35162/m.109909 type:complete len:86 (+) Transcript_35162:39-296(+)
MVASQLMYHAGSLLPGLNMFGSTRPKPISVPDLVCQHLDGQARVSALMYKDSAHGNKIGGALAMMKDLQAQRRRAILEGCPLPRI